MTWHGRLASSPANSTVSSAAGETTPAPAPVADASAPVANTEAPVILKQNAETASSASAASSPTAPQTEFGVASRIETTRAEKGS